MVSKFPGIRLQPQSGKAMEITGPYFDRIGSLRIAATNLVPAGCFSTVAAGERAVSCPSTRRRFPRLVK